MIGNTNLTLENYGDNTSNSDEMIYVDTDGVDATVNSSVAQLTFSTENGANPNCSQIIYAGLYWTGRVHNASISPSSFTIDENYSQHNNETQNSYSLSIARSGNTATYTFTPDNGGDVVIFQFTGSYWGSGNVRVREGSGSWTNVSGTFEDSNNTFHFNTPYELSTGSHTVKITALHKKRSSVNNNFYANITYAKAGLDKRRVKLRYENEEYINILASQNDIWYPSGQNSNIYAGYAEVTEYVREHGLGNYSVANIALLEGEGGSVGFFGGWAMVVVYQNSKMKWRDISVFDGYAFVQENASGGWQEHELTFSGYKAAQSGQINAKISIVAGEGDRGVGGSSGNRDELSIKKDEDGSWLKLQHDHNATDNFFVSAIETEGVRNPSLYNNTGLDIVTINLNNTGNQIIANNDTECTLNYGTNQDTYALMCIVMGIDAYVPEGEALNQVSTISGGAPSGTVNPGDEITYTIEIKNKGAEAINNFKMDIPIPYTASFAIASASYHSILSPTPEQPGYNPVTNSIVWDIGTLPDPTTTAGIDDNTVLATLTYTIKVTEDCYLLSDLDCNPTVVVSGFSSGIGATSGTDFSNLPMIYGYDNTGGCSEPITTPYSY